MLLQAIVTGRVHGAKRCYRNDRCRALTLMSAMCTMVAASMSAIVVDRMMGARSRRNMPTATSSRQCHPKSMHWSQMKSLAALLRNPTNPCSIHLATIAAGSTQTGRPFAPRPAPCAPSDRNDLVQIDVMCASSVGSRLPSSARIDTADHCIGFSICFCAVRLVKYATSADGAALGKACISAVPDQRAVCDRRPTLPV